MHQHTDAEETENDSRGPVEAVTRRCRTASAFAVPPRTDTCRQRSQPHRTHIYPSISTYISTQRQQTTTAGQDRSRNPHSRAASRSAAHPHAPRQGMYYPAAYGTTRTHIHNNTAPHHHTPPHSSALRFIAPDHTATGLPHRNQQQQHPRVSAYTNPHAWLRALGWRGHLQIRKQAVAFRRIAPPR
jgi:hypothetical protein